jgi:hypothetical protein
VLPFCRTPTGITSPQEPKTLSLTRKPARALVFSARWLQTTTRKPPAKLVSGKCAELGGVHLSIPVHKGRDLGVGLLRKLIRKAGLTPEEYISFFRGKNPREQ